MAIPRGGGEFFHLTARFRDTTTTSVEGHHDFEIARQFAGLVREVLVDARLSECGPMVAILEASRSISGQQSGALTQRQPLRNRMNPRSASALFRKKNKESSDDRIQDFKLRRLDNIGLR